MTRQKNALLVGLSVLFAIVFPGMCHADEITEKVLQAFRSQASELGVTAKSADELQVTGKTGPLSVYLFNVRAGCASNKDRCNEEVSTFVQRVASIASSEHSAGVFVAEKTYPVLRSAGFAKRGGDSSRAPGKQLIVMPFVEGIELLFAIDSATAVRFVNRDDLAGAGLTESELMALATRNASQLPVLKHDPINGMPGLFFMPTSDGLGTSRVFDPALWGRLETAAGGPLAMATPTRDWILFTRADQPEQVSKLRTLAGRIARGEPYAVSDAVMIREGNSWKRLTAQ